MDDDANQIEPPPSFVALFTTPSGRLTQPIRAVRERYELCEDMAQMMAEQAAVALFKSGGTEREVLEKMRTALGAVDDALPAPQIGWVLQRLAELLGWPAPSDPRA
jgi:hypothetical protein